METQITIDETTLTVDFADVFSVATHNGWITIHNPKTDDHRTFQIATSKSMGGKRVVSMLTGPDREDWRNWTGFGFASEDGSINVWRKHEGSVFEKMARLLERPDLGEEYGLNYLFEGRCRVCNRALTNPESIRTGIGPVCAGR